MSELDLSAYDFRLDPESIAQHPAEKRDASRLLLLDRAAGRWAEHRFDELPDLLQPSDLLVLNDARVSPARLRGTRPTGGGVAVLLVRPVAEDRWLGMARAARRLRPGERLTLERGRASLTVVGEQEGLYLFEGLPGGWPALEQLGRAPLPPYIRREADDPHRTEDLERYQTVYAGPPGAVAAPTAGLHFTPELLERVTARGVETARLTLRVGLGTFLPVKSERITEHPMHEEDYEVTAAAAEAIERARREGRRIVAVGTTSCRVLETLIREQTPPLGPAAGATRLFLHPPMRMALVGGLLTNFHLPKSTLLMLVSAMAGRELVLSAYTWARDNGFRFYSYGDAMLVV